MKKLKLDLAELRVESFDVDHAPDDPKGTVRAAAGNTNTPECQSVYCPITWNCSDDIRGCTENIFCVSIYPCIPTNEPTQCYDPNTCVDKWTCGGTCHVPNCTEG